MRAKYYKYKTKKKISNKNEFGYSCLILIVIAFVFAFIVRLFWFFPEIITMDSMHPQIKKNSFAMFTKPSIPILKKEKIVLIQKPYSKVPFFCRIIATENDRFKIDSKTVYVNNKKINSEKNQKISKNIKIPLKKDYHLSTIILPDYFFCINSNWNNTYDSRTFGVFHRNDIKKELLFYNFFQKG